MKEVSERFATESTVRTLAERTRLDFGTVLNVLCALDAERATQLNTN